MFYQILEFEAPADPFAALRCERIESWDTIEARARAVRTAWKLGIDPIPSMTELLEGKGIKVIEADLPERFDGISLPARSWSRASI